MAQSRQRNNTRLNAQPKLKSIYGNTEGEGGLSLPNLDLNASMQAKQGGTLNSGVNQHIRTDALMGLKQQRLGNKPQPMPADAYGMRLNQRSELQTRRKPDDVEAIEDQLNASGLGRSKSKAAAHRYRNDLAGQKDITAFKTTRKYSPILDLSARQQVTKTVGLSHKFKQPRDKRTLSKLFPSYGLYDEKQLIKSTKQATDIPAESYSEEMNNHNKLYFKQKYFMKDFMEEMLRNRAVFHPTKRQF